MRYIHARDTTSETRKYINIIFLVVAVVSIILTLFSLITIVNNVTKLVTARSSLERAETESRTLAEELRLKVASITEDEDYANYIIESSSTLANDRLDSYYPVVDLFTYLGSVEQDIMFYDLDISQGVVLIEGEALSPQDLLDFIDRIKRDKVFSAVRIKTFRYSDDFRVAAFSLELYTPDDIRINISNQQESGILINDDDEDIGDIDIFDDTGSDFFNTSVPSRIDQAPKGLIHGPRSTQENTEELEVETGTSQGSGPMITIEGLGD